jgi:hypothetical protein
MDDYDVRVAPPGSWILAPDSWFAVSASRAGGFESPVHLLKGDILNVRC